MSAARKGGPHAPPHSTVPNAPSELESSLTKLSISSDNGNKFQPKRKPVAESWEEEASDDEEPEVAKLDPTVSTDYPHAPPPTPISPLSPQVTRDRSVTPYDPEFFTGGGAERRVPPERRQEKTDAVAKRMIAGALGIRAPKKTEEQKAYEKAVREKEVKRRNVEKEHEAAAKAEAERLKAAAWED